MSWPALAHRAARMEARRLLTPTQRRAESHKDLGFWTSVGLGIAVLIGFIVILTHPGIHTTAIAAFGAALGAGGVLGFLFGVPGTARGPVINSGGGPVAIGTGTESKTTAASEIPKDNPDPTPDPTSDPNSTPDPAPDPSQTPLAAGTTPPPAGHPPTPVPPSNLEQVADWVTKLLLGGGLTQMQRIPPKIWAWAHIVALGVIGDNPLATPTLLAAQQAFAASLLVYGFILGFFSGFLITKLQLGKAIAD